ncbi:MAG: long-chain fatty acid transporter, partial [Cyclobacteriaceae bacterium]|nr:long-chain fatty acid transporter [Cyclobacteriaceae bacterium]
MKFRVLLQLAGVLVSVSTEMMAQGFVENALLFSRTKPGGSARIQALGGTQIALGGDYSSALSNPAGLGIYNRSEVTFSPALNFYTSDSEHNGTAENESKSVFNIPGLSYVHHSAKDKNGFLGG